MKYTRALIASLLLAPIMALRAGELPGSPSSSLPSAPVGFVWQAIPELSDEFNGTTLDLKKWQPRHPYWNGREPSAFDLGNVSVKEGMLRLRNTAKVDSLEGVKDVDKDVWVASACVTSVAPIASYGYYEARIKASKLSMTSSFWFQGKYSEIDVVEQVGDSIKNPAHDTLMMSNTHYFPDGWATDKGSPGRYPMTTGAAEAFHVYGVWWKDEKTIWMYLDGVKVGELEPAGLFKEPQYLFFDTEVFKWEGNPTIASLKDEARNTMLVDWVRGWRLVKEAKGKP